MEYYKISKTETGLNIEGFPDAVKVVRIDGPEAQRLADLSLHKDDLEFAGACLDAINKRPEESYVVREAIWRSAIVHFIKCFGTGVRFNLTAEEIYSGEPPEALEAFKYFKTLRNKHVVHDVNSYAQSIPGAILNNMTKDYKIEKIVCSSFIGSTLEQENYRNLQLLIQKAKVWVESEFDILCDRLTTELEKEPYDQLLAKESITYNVPNVDDIHHPRKTP